MGSDPTPYWFADVADDEDGMVHKDGSPYWKAWMQASGICADLPVWFDTKEAAEQFIATIPAGHPTPPATTENQA